MKNVNKLAVLLSLAALLAPALKAKSLEETYLETCRKDVGVPVPVVVVSPDVSPVYAGVTVEIEFTVEATGKTTAFSVKSSPDAEIGATVVDAVKKWKFKPAVSGGVAVATKVALPVRIVDAPLAGNRFAAN